jgi:hypothetical protein
MQHGLAFAMSESRPICGVCRRSITSGEGVQIAAAGKTLFEVHKGECEATVKTGVKTAGVVALNIAETALEVRAPKALALVKGFAALLQQLRGHTP